MVLLKYADKSGSQNTTSPGSAKLQGEWFADNKLRPFEATLPKRQNLAPSAIQIGPLIKLIPV